MVIPQCVNPLFAGNMYVPGIFKIIVPLEVFVAINPAPAGGLKPLVPPPLRAVPQQLQKQQQPTVGAAAAAKPTASQTTDQVGSEADF